MKDIDAICRQYHQRCFLAYGTLLGTVRHKGFIPWDDDIAVERIGAGLLLRVCQIGKKTNEYGL